jgi:hypothetical protein
LGAVKEEIGTAGAQGEHPGKLIRRNAHRVEDIVYACGCELLRLL